MILKVSNLPTVSEMHENVRRNQSKGLVYLKDWAGFTCQSAFIISIEGFTKCCVCMFLDMSTLLHCLTKD